MNDNNFLKPANKGRSAPLRNLAVLESLLLELKDRPDHLPGIGVFSGPSGFGKSTAAAYVSAEHQAHYLEVRSTWTKKVFLENLISQLGVSPKKTTAELAAQAAEELAITQKVMILDEFDNAVDRNLIETVRDLYEQSQAPIILIGEERLPIKLQKWERFHGRILSWKQSNPADLNDAQILAQYYSPKIAINDDLLERIVVMARGSVHRIVVNIHKVDNYAKNAGFKSIGLDEWGNQELSTGNPPAARKF